MALDADGVTINNQYYAPNDSDRIPPKLLQTDACVL